jgi:hypothetical protein
MHRTIAFANHRICGSPAARLPNRSRMGEASALASTAWYFHIRRKPWQIYHQGTCSNCHREYFAELSTCNRLTGLQCVNLSTSAAYATGSLVAIISPVFWNRDYGAGFSFLYLLTTQMLGYCINCTPIFATLLTTRVDLGSPVLHEDGWSTPAHSSGPRHSLPQFCSVLCMNRKTVHLPMAGC